VPWKWRRRGISNTQAEGVFVELLEGGVLVIRGETADRATPKLSPSEREWVESVALPELWMERALAGQDGSNCPVQPLLHVVGVTFYPTSHRHPYQENNNYSYNHYPDHAACC
jgi:hypothetical protein